MARKPTKLSGKQLEGNQEIADVDAAGRGIIRIGEHSVLVPGTYTGETVRAQFTHRGKHAIHYAVAIEVVEPSPHRVDSPCPHFLDCGGCDLLHIHPEEQLAWKRRAISEALALPNEAVDEVVCGEDHYDYRALAKFVVARDGSLGSYRRHSHDIAPMDECVVHTPAIAAAHELTQQKIVENKIRELRYVVMRASSSEERAIVTLISGNPRAGLFREFAHDLGSAPFVSAVDFHHNDSTGNAVFTDGPTVSLYDDGKELTETIGKLRLQLKSNAFSQINPAAAEKLYERVAQALAERWAPEQTVLDLYAGSGGIGLTFLLHNPEARVLAVETSKEANNAATATAHAHGIAERHEVRTQTALEFLQQLKEISPLVVVNPPRKGLGTKVVDEILRLGPTHLLYVSCNPTSLAKDATKLSGYKIEKCIPFDLFPNTAQIETLAIFSKV